VLPYPRPGHFLASPREEGALPREVQSRREAQEGSFGREGGAFSPAVPVSFEISC
jgi:hypothetical protein